MRSTRIQLPFPFGVEVLDDAHGLSTAELRIVLRSVAGQRSDVVRILDGASEAGQGRLVVARDRLLVDLGSVTSATLHLPDDRLLAGGLERVAVDLLTLAGVAFAHVGQADLAGRLASSYLARSDLLDQPEAPWAFSSAMARARQVREALDLSDEIDAAALAGDSAQMFTLLVRFHAGTLTQAEEQLAVGVMQRRIDRRRQRGDRSAEAQECVNLGNFFRSRASWREAITLYERALQADPSYASHAHYWHDKAGVLFGGHRYEESALAYGRAADLGSGGLTRALQADALLFAGRYAAARALWSTFVATEHNRAQAAEYRLKLDFVDQLIETVGMESQDRVVAGQETPLIGGDEPPAVEEARAAAVDALASDALDARAWELLAWADIATGDLDGYVRHTLYVALLLEGSVEGWLQAVVTRLGTLDERFVPEMLVTGERLTGGRLLAALADFARERIADDERGVFLARVETLFRSIPPEVNGGFALRFLEEGGRVTEIAMPSAEPWALAAFRACRLCSAP